MAFPDVRSSAIDAAFMPKWERNAIFSTRRYSQCSRDTAGGSAHSQAARSSSETSIAAAIFLIASRLPGFFRVSISVR
jgi:hypothetical protein